MKDFANFFDLNINAVESMLKNVKIKSQISINTPKFNFNFINPDSNYLATLIISEENGKAACSQADISGGFGSFIVSLKREIFQFIFYQWLMKNYFLKKNFLLIKLD